MTNVLANAILDLNGRAMRADKFTFELVDVNLVHKSWLSVGKTPPTIAVNTANVAVWSMSNVSLYNVALSNINVFSDRVRVSMVLSDGTTYPLGVYVFGTTPKNRRASGDIWTPSMFDDMFFVDQALDTPVSVATGGSILTAFQTLAARYGLPIDTLGVGDVAATEPLTWAPGANTGYQALKGMATVLGCFPPFMSATRVLTLRQPPFPGDTSVLHVYGPGTHVVKDKSVLTSDLYQLPNRWIVYATSQNQSIIGVYDLPPSAPASAANRGGRVVAKASQLSGIPIPTGFSLQQAANLAARTVALQDPTVYEKAVWNTTADPRHGVFDTVELYGARYLETGWSIVAKSGEQMTHDAIRLYD